MRSDRKVERRVLNKLNRQKLPENAPDNAMLGTFAYGNWTHVRVGGHNLRTLAWKMYATDAPCVLTDDTHTILMANAEAIERYELPRRVVNASGFVESNKHRYLQEPEYTKTGNITARQAQAIWERTKDRIYDDAPKYEEAARPY